MGGSRHFPVLQPGASCRDEQHFIEREVFTCRLSYDEMPVVHGIEGTAEDTQPLHYSHDHSLPPISNTSPGPAPALCRASSTPACSRCL